MIMNFLKKYSKFSIFIKRKLLIKYNSIDYLHKIIFNYLIQIMDEKTIINFLKNNQNQKIDDSINKIITTNILKDKTIKKFEEINYMILDYSKLNHQKEFALQYFKNVSLILFHIKKDYGMFINNKLFSDFKIHLIDKNEEIKCTYYCHFEIFERVIKNFEKKDYFISLNDVFIY
jgi:hypothetical protein